MAPSHVTVCLYEGLESLPPFNPDHAGESVPVNQLRMLIKESAGIIFSTPEYAFGVPGVLKNALDWLVSSGELNEKPVAAISASPLFTGGDKALASLQLTLTALGTTIKQGPTLSIGNIKNKLDASGDITDEATLQLLDQLLKDLLTNIVAGS